MLFVLFHYQHGYFLCCRYWADIDTELRRVAFERAIHVRLLISCWDSTSAVMFPFLRSLASVQDSKSKLDIQVVSDSKNACKFSHSVMLYNYICLIL